MGLFNELIRMFIPNRNVRSAVRRGGRVASKTAAHAAYEADRDAIKANALKDGDRTTSAVFPVLPMTKAELLASPYNNLMTPMNTTALFVVALNVYNQNRDESIAMINYLRGPNPLSADDVKLIDERMAQNNKAGCLAQSYLAGAAPQNSYTPSQPYTVVITDNFYTYYDREVATVYVMCGGADTPRPVTLCKAGDGLWYLGELSLLEGIRPPV